MLLIPVALDTVGISKIWKGSSAGNPALTPHEPIGLEKPQLGMGFTGAVGSCTESEGRDTRGNTTSFWLSQSGE